MGSVNSSNNKNEEIDNFISWFEIPAFDFKQAVEFYNFIFDIEMKEIVSDNSATAYFPTQNGVGGAITSGYGYEVGTTGPLIYLNGGDDLSIVLDKVENAGGKVVMPKTLISKESGYFAVFIDSQGNKLALHSKN